MSRFLALLCTLLLGSEAAADGGASVFLRQQSTAPGLSAETQLELVRGALAAQRVPVCRLDRGPDVLPEARKLSALLAQAGCGRVLVIHTEASGSTWQVTLQELAPASGEVLRQDRATAASPEEIQDRVPHLVRQLLRQPAALKKEQQTFHGPADAPGLQRQVEDENRGMRPRKSRALRSPSNRVPQPSSRPISTKGFGLGLAVRGPLDGSAAPGLGLSGFFSQERGRRRLDASLRAQRQLDGSGSRVAFTLGGAYLLGQGNTRPYLAASIGYGSLWDAQPPTDGAFAALGEFGAGMEWFRQHEIRLRLDLRLAVPLSSAHRAHGLAAQGLLGFVWTGPH